MIAGKHENIESINEEYYFLARKGEEKHVVTGPYVNITKGSYHVEFELRPLEAGNTASKEIIAVADVCTNHGARVIARKVVREFEIAQETSLVINLAFRLEETGLVEFRVYSSGRKDFGIRIRRRLTETDDEGKVFIEDFPSNKPFSVSHKPDTRISPFFDLDKEVLLEDGKIPMFWNKSDPGISDPNMGDSLAPIVVEAMCGHDSSFREIDHPGTRFLSTGTILNWQKCGHVHVWGTGLDPWIDHNRHFTTNGYAVPNGLTLRVHAVRGALTRKHLLKAGIDCPEIYGDPGCLIPKIIPPSPEKKYELGIIPHISNFTSEQEISEINKHLARYDIGENDQIKIISTRHGASLEDFIEKIKIITSCKRIISSSYHGLIIPLAYGIPSVFFQNDLFEGIFDADLDDLSFDTDHRVRDFMLGMNYRTIPMYATKRTQKTDWGDVIRAIDQNIVDFQFDTRMFEDAFPFRKKPADTLWSIDERKKQRILF